MANTKLVVTLEYLWWHHPVKLLMKACVFLGWEFSEETVERFVVASTRIVAR